VIRFRIVLRRLLGADTDVLVNCTGRVVRCREEKGKRAVAAVIDEYNFERVYSRRLKPAALGFFRRFIMAARWGFRAAIPVPESWPFIAMMKLGPIACAKQRNEIEDKLILRFLPNSHRSNFNRRGGGP